MKSAILKCHSLECRPDVVLYGSRGKPVKVGVINRAAPAVTAAECRCQVLRASSEVVDGGCSRGQPATRIHYDSAVLEP